MKRFVAAVLTLLCAALVFAQKSPYDLAPADTQVLLKKADDLIQKEQYESAFGALNALDDEFVLAKKNRNCNQLFCSKHDASNVRI